MKSPFSNLAIQSLAMVYVFAGIYIGCGQQQSKKSPKIALDAKASKDPKVGENKLSGQAEINKNPDSAKEGKSDKSKKNKDEEEEDGDDTKDSSKSKSSKGKTESTKGDKVSQSSLAKSLCGKKFSDLDEEYQDMIKERVGKKVAEKYLSNIKLTNCKVDSKGKFTFEIEFDRDDDNDNDDGKGKGWKGLFDFGRNRNKDSADEDLDD